MIGRVMRTRTLAFVPDIAADPDYLSAAGAVRAEISAPLLVDGGLVGIINVEARAPADLDASDIETMRLVAERMASALALAGERSGWPHGPSCSAVSRRSRPRSTRPSTRSASTRRSSTASPTCSPPTSWA